MKTARNITLVSLLLAAGGATLPAYAYNGLNWDWLDRFAVKATVTYTEPNQQGFDFGALLTGGGAQYVEFVGVKQEFDYALGLELRLANTDNRLFFDYDHYDADQDSSLNTVAGGQVSLLTGAGATTASTGEYDFDSDAMKLGIRHRLSWGPQAVDFGMALSWIDVDRDFTATQTTAGVTTTLHNDASFRGFGPYFDLATKYNLTFHRFTRGLNLQAYLGGGLLYSESEFTSSLSTGVVFDREKVKGLTSEAMMKLAIGWDYCFTTKSMLSMALGYMMVRYDDAFNNGATAGAYNVPGAAPAGRGNASGSFPFTRQGPFLEFKFSAR